MIRDLEAASAATIMAAVDAGNRAFWIEREVALGQAQQAAHALASPPRLAAWQADLREAAARLRTFPWYFGVDAMNGRAWCSLNQRVIDRDFPHPGFNDVEDA